MQKLIIITFLFCYQSAKADTLSLSKAIKSNILKCSFEGNSNSTHYLNPLMVSLESKENKFHTIIIENGQQFISSDSSLQNLVIVKREVITLPPYQKKTSLLSAMCIEMHDGGPQSKVAYAQGKMSDGFLLELTKLIDKQKYFDIAAQQAIWCLINKSPIGNIDGFDSTEVRALQQLVSKATGQPIPKYVAANNYRQPVITDTLEGSFTYMVRQESEVLIAMFDKSNRVVRELYRNNKEPVGKKDFHFVFDSTVYQDEVYYIRLLINGEKRIEGTVRNSE
ncbi:MAG: hypothetical protein ABI723_01610 [Bacteroidia bacterium]